MLLLTVIVFLLLSKKCILLFRCDTYSNCLPGNHKTIKNCTIFSKPVCDGCAEENFFNPNVGVSGGCVECSPSCGPLEVETRSCNTDHDRTCEVKSLSKIPNLSKFIYFTLQHLIPGKARKHVFRNSRRALECMFP